MYELAAARKKRMPMVRVERDYRFEGPDGERALPELFEGPGRLVLYRFFFEEGVAGWPDAGCVGCSSVADGIPQLGLLHARDITSPWRRRPTRRTSTATPIAWGGRTCPGARSAPRASRRLRGGRVVRLHVFPRHGGDVYRTYSPSTARWSNGSAAFGASGP
jgi:hypothetical protein